MDTSKFTPDVTRRRTFALRSDLTSGLLAAGLASPAAADSYGGGNSGDQGDGSHRVGAKLFPVGQMQQILQASGTVSGDVLSFNIDWNDFSVSLSGGVPVAPAELLNAQLYFQPIGQDVAILDVSICLKPSETNPFIDTLIANGLTAMAFHQRLTI